MKKNLTYELFSNVIKLLWILNIAVNEVSMMLHFIDLSLNFLLIFLNVTEVVRGISWVIKKILMRASFSSQFVISGIFAIEAEKTRSPKLVRIIEAISRIKI